MKKKIIRPVPIFAFFLVLASLTAFTFFNAEEKASAAAANVVGVQLQDVDCTGAAGTARYAPDVGAWSTPWAGDNDNYDPDCIRLYVGNDIPPDLDIRVGIQARDINSPCGFLWLFKCGDGGGTIIYGPWASAAGSRNFTHSWTAWATDVDGWDPDQWRIIVDTQARYGYTVSDFKLGIQVADMTGWGASGCTEQTGTTRYTASSSAAAAWSAWSVDNDAINFNCARVNLIATTTRNPATVNLNGTTTAPYNNSVNVSWDVQYINTTSGCTLVGRNSGGSIVDPSVTVTTANGPGSATSMPIAYPVTYTLTCAGADGASVSDTITISPFGGAPATLSFTMSPTSGLSPGDTSVATVSVNNTTASAISCTLTGRDADTNITDGPHPWTVPAQSETVTTYATTTYSGVHVFLTSGAGTNQTWTPPASPANLKWQDTGSYVEVIGGGGGGGSQDNSVGQGGGGGGGAYSRANNLNLTAGTPVTYRIGAGGSNGTTGGDTFFNRTSGSANTCADTSSVCAKGGIDGSDGSTVASCANTGEGCGGVAASGIGATRYSGGNGGTSNNWGGGGGGGAAGPNGAGKNGGNSSHQGGAGGGGGNNGTVGANATTATGAAGGAGGGDGSSDGGRGSNGQQGAYNAANDAVDGSAGGDFAGSARGGGGGGGGGSDNSVNNIPGTGGLYGGGAGGDGDDSVCCGTSDGAAGIIHIYYEPADTATQTDSLTDNTNATTSPHVVYETTNFTVACTGITSIVRTVSMTSCYVPESNMTVANGGSANFWTQATPASGAVCTPTYGPISRTCTAGVLSGDNSYVYQCVNQDNIIISANNIRAVTSVRKGTQIALGWNGGNADSCTVTGTDGFDAASVLGTVDIAATTTVTVNQKTVYTAQCTYGSSTKSSSVTVNILPSLIEI